MSSSNRTNQQKDRAVSVLRQKRVATMEDLQSALRTNIRMTVHRTLKEIDYQTSYSHGGRYYALKKGLRFDEHGLVSVRSICFSKDGTLMATLERLIREAERGYFSGELESLLHVGTKESLLRLLQQGRIARERVARGYLYCTPDVATRRQQLAARSAEIGKVVLPVVVPENISDEIKAAIVLFSALLDERLRRLFAGVQALEFGNGAEGWIADLLGIHRQTVAKGRRELLDGNVLVERVRRKGAGRPRIEKKVRRSSKKSKS